MACDSIYRTPVRFENALYKPGNMETFIDAVDAMGFEFEDNVQLYRKHLPSGIALVIWPKGENRNSANTVIYRDGQFRIPQQMDLDGRFTVERVQTAYAMQTAKQTAKRNGWVFTQTSQTEFEFRQR